MCGRAGCLLITDYPSSTNECVTTTRHPRHSALEMPIDVSAVPATGLSKERAELTGARAANHVRLVTVR
jgi:hypothetical protein